MDALRELRRLGISERSAKACSTITRGTFVRWLVLANNRAWADTSHNLIAKAGTEPASFSDVTASDPDFPYIQGVMNQGIDISFGSRTFRPNDTLTRPEFVAIKALIDWGAIDKRLCCPQTINPRTLLSRWKDYETISGDYLLAIATGQLDDAGLPSVRRIGTFESAFGRSDVFHPEFPVVEAEAASGIQVIGPHVNVYDGHADTLPRRL